MSTAVLTGEVHIGKTTVCQAVVDLARRRGYCVSGILTPPILDENGQRVGITVLDLTTGEQRELARIGLTFEEARADSDWGGPTVGLYHFSPSALQWGQDVMAHAIAAGCDLLVVDEIGRLELEQNTGFNHVLDLLATSVVPRSLVVVRKPLLEAFQRCLPRLAFVTFEVTLDNRNTLATEILERLLLVR